MPPHWEHYPEHDHAADNEEELYIPLEGSGTLHAEGQTYPMKRGVLIRVGAATKRKIVPGPEGMTLLVLSDRPESQSPCRPTERCTHRYPPLFSRSHHAVIRVYDEGGDVIETHEHTGDFKE